MNLRILRLPQVIELLGISRSTIYDKLNPKSPRYDSTFPKPIKLGASAIGWTQESIESWLLNKIQMIQ